MWYAKPWVWVVIVYAFASVVTLLAYGIDKRCAVLNRRRIKERTLHWMELAGGWPGALAGQGLFKHKRCKSSFMVVFWGIVLLHLAGWGAWWWFTRAA